MNNTTQTETREDRIAKWNAAYSARTYKWVPTEKPYAVRRKRPSGTMGWMEDTITVATEAEAMELMRCACAVRGTLAVRVEVAINASDWNNSGEWKFIARKARKAR